MINYNKKGRIRTPCSSKKTGYVAYYLLLRKASHFGYQIPLNQYALKNDGEV